MNSENANRLHAKRLISLFPGVHLRKLSRYLGVSMSTTRYHVVNLERDGEIICWKEGEYLRAYPLWAGDERSRRVYAILQQKAARRILRVLLTEYRARENRTTNAWIAKVAHLSQSTVCEYLAALRELQLIEKVVTSDGRMVSRVSETDRGRLLLILSLSDRSFLSKATDNYVDLWDF